MDFSFSEEQLEISKLANKIIGDHSNHDRLRELEAADKHVDDALWRDLATAGLLGLSLPVRNWWELLQLSPEQLRQKLSAPSQAA